VLNSPCYGRERATATGLLVVRVSETRPETHSGKPLP
jgi:hypothetical protein